jgi:hypothetical protein
VPRTRARFVDQKDDILDSDSSGLDFNIVDSSDGDL